MWHVRFSDRDATCVKCDRTIIAFEPRVDRERDEEKAQDRRAGWRTERFCLECALPIMRTDLQELTNELNTVENAWINTQKRYGRGPIKRFKPKQPKTKVCDECQDKAVLVLNKKQSGKLFVCPNGHFWVE